MAMVPVAHQERCVVCDGYGGWSRSSFHPTVSPGKLEPQHTPSDDDWQRCFYCDGWGRMVKRS